MARRFNDWIQEYINYASFSEAPTKMHFWSGVAAVAGTLRRHVWIDQVYFKWYANHYIVFVAPPGIVSKSTTVAIAMDILRKVSGVGFGPDVVTWPALVTAFAGCRESFQVGDDWYTQCALTLESSEFGNLVNPQDREMIDLLVTLWDARTGAFSKKTKTSGNDEVENPWINMIACTTPAWIAGNFPEYVIGGGFTSRCLFVYADKKEKYIAYPSLETPPGLRDRAILLADDLAHMAEVLKGPYELTADAIAWGRIWYKHHYDHPPPELARDERFGGYLARKQTHIHKLAMVLAAAQRDEMRITADDLALAEAAISALESDMPKVFARIGRTEESIQAERFVKFVHSFTDEVAFDVAYQFVYTHFPKAQDFEAIFKGAMMSGQIRWLNDQNGSRFVAIRKPEEKKGSTAHDLQCTVEPNVELRTVPPSVR